MPRFTVDLSEELDKRLREIAQANGITKAEAIRRAFTLLSVADTEKKRNRHMGFFTVNDNGDKEITSEIVGL
ncbi:putative transcriptional regulator [Erwinia toletana]|uniref:Transcriptional regulator n=1 Tax=Winslowiella toletana TaxID=92490 RepID=A0ABS4P9Y1_9GAMM|nr:ribbon-helix-helix domain-containing protein [Winslowiella toletana]MBP2169441.1 putative transcriptional regulator [Winslowiella toletana]